MLYLVKHDSSSVPPNVIFHTPKCRVVRDALKVSLGYHKYIPWPLLVVFTWYDMLHFKFLPKSYNNFLGVVDVSQIWFSPCYTNEDHFQCIVTIDWAWHPVGRKTRVRMISPFKKVTGLLSLSLMSRRVFPKLWNSKKVDVREDDEYKAEKILQSQVTSRFFPLSFCC